MLPSILFTAFIAVLSLTFKNAMFANARVLSDSDLENSYIVKLKDGINTTSHINTLPFSFSVEDVDSPITHWWPDSFKGYSGIFVGTDFDAILASPDVEYVERNGIVRGSGSQTGSIWNLQAISTRRPVGGTDVEAWNYIYFYNQPLGEGVDIYIVDSGVYIEHLDFTGRATFGWAAPGLEPGDNHGHGTHVAGIAAGRVLGVAKNANIIDVKVLYDDNKGYTDDLIGGINWVTGNVRRTGKPSIACIAIDDKYSLAINKAVAILVASGVTVVVSAGNRAAEASGWSPASAPAAIVVGASDIKNIMWPGSNFGETVDVFAPGVDIRAAGHTGQTEVVMGTGSSQACAHVAGIAANFLSMNTRMTPAVILNEILSLATKNVITGVPEGTTSNFVFNGGGIP